MVDAKRENDVIKEEMSTGRNNGTIKKKIRARTDKCRENNIFFYILGIWTSPRS